jgi:arginase family enzyme
VVQLVRLGSLLGSRDAARRRQPGRVALLGIPLDENSSYLRGCALGPAGVREVIASGSSNLCAEDGTDVGSDRASSMSATSS